MARAIAEDGTRRRILHDPADGRQLHYGRTTYTPSADLTRHIIARDRTCTFRTAPNPRSAATSTTRNLGTPAAAPTRTTAAPCAGATTGPRTVGGWTLQRNPDHTCTWTSPTGHIYTVHPPPIGGP